MTTSASQAMTPSQLPASVDVVVIGAGPSGSIAALTLAAAGRSVLILERRSLPRFHIGESQLCYTAEILRQTGLYDEAKSQGYPVKTGAEFIFPNGDFRRTNFADQGPGHGAPWLAWAGSSPGRASRLA
ncbi:MAG TPA: FAD-dependent oxidoreductase [Streptosporangiaceae bacterium]|jgi:FADH2-dependent halogenase|nr:FAD-dependent oxidoreductase [Streptosporangiaceae bacterium]